MRAIAVVLCAVISGCAIHPATERVTDAEGTWVQYVPVPMSKPTYADGTPIPNAELKRIGWEPPKRQPLWQCYGLT